MQVYPINETPVKEFFALVFHAPETLIPNANFVQKVLSGLSAEQSDRD